MVTITAQNILDENKYTSADVNLINTESIIDNAIDYINLKTGLTISAMAGSAGSKTVTVTRAQAPVIKALCSLQVHGYVNADAVATEKSEHQPNEAQIELLKEIVKEGIERLKELPIVIANEPLPNE